MDIFTLGSCLYEMLTLSRLPPKGITEPEYRNMLISRKRPQISAKVSTLSDEGRSRRGKVDIRSVGGQN